MGINFLEGLGYVAQGALEKDEEIRQEKLASRMEEMKENRALYREIAKTRYATDLATYEKESANLANMNKALKAISAGNGMSKRQAALTLIEADPSKFNMFKELGDDDKEIMLQATMGDFVDQKDASGANIGFSVQTPLQTVTRPNELDYFNKTTKGGEDFWKAYAEEIRTTTDGPLSKQVKKLLGRDVKPENQLKLDMEVQGTTIRNNLELSEPVVSKNTSTIDYGFSEGILKANFNTSLDGIDASFYDDAVQLRTSVLTGKAPATENIMSTLNTIVPDFSEVGGDYVTKWDRESGEITLTPQGSLYYQQMKQLYYETEKVYFGQSFYSGGNRKGTDWSSGEFLELYRQEVSNRTINIASDKPYLFGLWGERQVASLFVLNERVLPIGEVLTSQEKDKLMTELNEFVNTEEFKVVTNGKGITNNITENVVNQGASQIVGKILKEREDAPPTADDVISNITITEEMIQQQMEENNKTRAEVIDDFLNNPVKGNEKTGKYQFIFPPDFDYDGEETAKANKEDEEYVENALNKPPFNPTGPLSYTEWQNSSPEEVAEAYKPTE